MKNFTFILFLLSFQVLAAGKFEVASHQEVLEFMKKEGMLKRHTLIVYDIDNTLLKSKHEFGSDQWFNWQSKELAEGGPDSLGKNFNELMEIQNQIFTLGEMELVEEEVLAQIELFKKKELAIIALTSRGPDLKNATFRELQKHSLNFNDSKVGHDLIPEFSLNGGTQKLLYENGIFMTSGSHKGEMLKYILDKFNLGFKNIIFIDDHQKHTDRVFETLNNEGENINVFRYGHEDNRVKNFNSSTKGEAKYLGKKLLELRNQLRSSN